MNSGLSNCLCMETRESVRVSFSVRFEKTGGEEGTYIESKRLLPSSPSPCFHLAVQYSDDSRKVVRGHADKHGVIRYPDILPVFRVVTWRAESDEWGRCSNTEIECVYVGQIIMALCGAVSLNPPICSCTHPFFSSARAAPRRVAASRTAPDRAGTRGLGSSLERSHCPLRQRE